MFNIFGKKKKEFEEQKRALEERRQFIDGNIEHSNKIQEETKDTQKSTLEIARQNYELNERLTNLVAENKEKENILMAREQSVKSSEDDIEERKNIIRREEINLEARKSEIRKKEHEVSENENDVKEREVEAQKVKSESEQTKAEYQNLFDELEAQKDNIAYLEKEANRKNDLAAEREAAAHAVFEKAKTIDDEIKAKEAEFEARREEIESSLKAKVEEYDRKIADMESVREFIDDVKFDESEDGKQAKIVVKEAIRIAKKQLGDIKIQFDELDEKYCSGTFKGFSTPISEIDKSFEDLKTQYQQIKEHIEANDVLPKSIYKWLDNIEEYINNADISIKSWEFSSAHRSIVFGLSTCKNYELLLTILDEWQSSETSSENEDIQNEEFTDWYEVLDVSPDATIKEIKKHYRELAKKYHPDTAMDDEERKEFEDKMRLINEAWSILEDGEKRKEFDEKRKNHKG